MKKRTKKKPRTSKETKVIYCVEVADPGEFNWEPILNTATLNRKTARTDAGRYRDNGHCVRVAIFDRRPTRKR